MRIANFGGRLVIGDVETEDWIDVSAASGSRFSASPQAAFERWDELLDWATNRPHGDLRVDPPSLGAPSPAPRQIFAIGLNYRDHAAESGFALPTAPPVFTKYVTSLTGPSGDIALPPGDVDWEVELVVVLGRQAYRVPEDTAWDYVAGVTIGQDLSERRAQMAGPVPQFSLAKSHPGFGPTGPWLVTPDELTDPDDLAIEASLNGENMQKGRTSDMIFSVPELIARLSAVTPLLPGDVIFTGTPAGVGVARTPQRFLTPGDELVSHIEGVGTMHHHFVAPTPRPTAARDLEVSA